MFFRENPCFFHAFLLHSLIVAGITRRSANSTAVDKSFIFKEATVVNKTELVASVAEKTGLTKKDAEKAVNALFDSVQEALTAGDKVQMIGFGTFEVKERAARKGRNPRTGQDIEIPASKNPVFKAGKALKDSVNG